MKKIKWRKLPHNLTDGIELLPCLARSGELIEDYKRLSVLLKLHGRIIDAEIISYSDHEGKIILALRIEFPNGWSIHGSLGRAKPSDLEEMNLGIEYIPMHELNIEE